KPMVSKEAKADLDILINMELKLRLLDIEADWCGWSKVMANLSRGTTIIVNAPLTYLIF
ncbi:unnamed protein product, partial [Allacma fusca]